MNRLVVVIILILLTGCSAKPLNVNYYLLYTPEMNEEQNVGPKSNYVSVHKILLADYLKQSGMAMQMDQNVLYFSRQDVWAEGLQGAILNALLADLNLDPQTQYSAYDSPANTESAIALTVQFEHFHATNHSTVVTTGRYWIDNSQTKLSEEKSFYFSLELQQDGFSHAVAQQRQLIKLLATQIRQDINSQQQTTSENHQ